MSQKQKTNLKERKPTVDADILVVDDILFNVRLLVDLLNMDGYRARVALNGAQALLAARTQPPDLILLDIIMPGMDGYEVCRLLKADQRTRDIPIIFISSLNEVLDKVKAFSSGAVDYITKPFQMEEVMARIETHLTLRKLQRILQVKNSKLKEEIIRRKEAEQLLAEYNRTLEQRVAERTTELAQATREAQEARLAAEAANQAKSVFLANVSHELRTPLNAILGFAQVMSRSQRLPDELRENLNIINRSGQQLLTLINNILDFSKIEAGYMTLHETNFDLYWLLEELEQMFDGKAKRKNLIFELTRDSTLPQYVRTDSVKLRQVLISLVDNAIKFTEKGGVLLAAGFFSTKARSSLPKSMSQSAKLHFEIEDTGVGIAADDIESIFSPFVQSEGGMQQEEGTGLGLSISRQFVRLMGGEMSLTSEVGHGTIFYFDIPVSLVDPADIKERQPTRRVIALEPNQPHYRILIVDDKSDHRQILINLLHPLDFALKQAKNGKEAVDIWQKWQPHLIWMDIGMPVMDGYEASKQIKAQIKGQATIIIALTASAFEEERAVMLEAGCDDFLRKPVHEEDIFDLMHKHIGVRYIYAQPMELRPTCEPQESLNPSALRQKQIARLATLNIELLTTLEEAVEASDLEMIEQVIKQIATHDAALGKHLTMLANDFEYDEILDLILEAKEVE